MIFTTQRLYDAETPIVEAQVSGPDGEEARTFVPYTQWDPAPDYVYAGSTTPDMAVVDAAGQAGTLFDENTTRLAVIDYTAACCPPSHDLAANYQALVSALGPRYDVKTVLVQDADYQRADTTDAARWALQYSLYPMMFLPLPIRRATSNSRNMVALRATRPCPSWTR